MIPLTGIEPVPCPAPALKDTAKAAPLRGGYAILDRRRRAWRADSVGTRDVPPITTPKAAARGVEQGTGLDRKATVRV